MAMRSAIGAWLLLLMGSGVGVLLLLPWIGRAEPQRVEVVGTYGIRDSLRTEVIARDAAVENALWEGVSRVALELIGESSRASGMERDPMGNGAGAPEEEPRLDVGREPGPNSTEPAGIDEESLRAALGEDVLPYTRSFRILEDQGEQPVLFEDEPDVQTEYVVVVEVIVDAGRVMDALEQEGWIVSSRSEPSNEVRLELMGLRRHAALETFREALREGLGARRVQTLAFAPARQLLAVEGAFGSEQVRAWLSRFEDPQLLLEPLPDAEGDGRLRVRARWMPLDAQADPSLEEAREAR